MNYTICLELGGTNLRSALVDRELSACDYQKIPTAQFAAGDQLAWLFARFDQLVTLAGGTSKVAAISLSLATLMDPSRRILYSTPNVPGFDRLSVIEMLEERYSVPVFAEKDAACMLLYEMQQHALPTRGITTGIFLGTGLGSAMCIDGKPYAGHSGSACELGHIPAPGASGTCVCGKEGCMERIASGKQLEWIAAELGVDIRAVFTKAAHTPLIREFVRYMGLAVATQVAILDPAQLVLGGGVLSIPGFPFALLEEVIRANLRAPVPRESLRIVYASGDAEAGVVGAAINARLRTEACAKGTVAHDCRSGRLHCPHIVETDTG